MSSRPGDPDEVRAGVDAMLGAVAEAFAKRIPNPPAGGAVWREKRGRRLALPFAGRKLQISALVTMVHRRKVRRGSLMRILKNCGRTMLVRPLA